MGLLQMTKKHDIPQGATMHALDDFDQVVFLKYEDDALMVYSQYNGWEQADEDFFE